MPALTYEELLVFKFAPTCPARIYEGFLSEGYVPGTVLLLAHDVVGNAQEYSELFKRKEWDNTTIIMDNSLVELGKAVDTDMVEEAVELTGADIAVLPDVMGSGEETVHATLEVYMLWRRIFSGRQLMAMLHGRDIVDWFNTCAVFGDQLDPQTWIGIPRITEGIKDPHTGKVYNRYELVKIADRLFPGWPQHLFGFSNSPYEDLKAASLSCVRSIDSAVPLRLGSLNIFSEDPGKRGTWWEDVKFDRFMCRQCRNVDHWISRLAVI
jgi:hypothetical protein